MKEVSDWAVSIAFWCSQRGQSLQKLLEKSLRRLNRQSEPPWSNWAESEEMNLNRKLPIISVRAADDLVAKIDSWTKRNAAGLSRAQAITQLAEIGLRAAEVARKHIGAESPMTLELGGLEINRIVTRQREKLLKAASSKK